MVAIEQNMLYIIIAVLLIVIILIALYIRRRGSKKSPSVNKYLKEEANHKKLEIVERDIGFKLKIPLYMKRPEDELEDIRETTSKLEHRNAYYSSKVESRIERLESQEKKINIQRQLKDIKKKDLKLNRLIEPKKD